MDWMDWMFLCRLIFRAIQAESPGGIGFMRSIRSTPRIAPSQPAFLPGPDACADPCGGPVLRCTTHPEGCRKRTKLYHAPTQTIDVASDNTKDTEAFGAYPPSPF